MRVDENQELRHWRTHGYSNDEARRFFVNSTPADLLIKFDWQNHSRCGVETKQMPPLYMLHILQFLEHLFSQINPAAKGVVIACLHDGLPQPRSQTVPVLTFGKKMSDTYSVLLPNPEFTGSLAHRDAVHHSQRLQKEFPWEKRYPVAFWRGSSTGAPLSKELWQENTRVKLCQLSAALGYSILDAGFSEIVQCNDPWVEQEIGRQGLLKDRVQPLQFFSYKYLVEVDGNSCTWSSFFWKLASGSLMFKVESDNVQWISGLPQPWVHYIPVKSDLSDLAEKIQWAKDHDIEARNIAAAAAQLAHDINFATAVHYGAGIINGLLAAAKE